MEKNGRYQAVAMGTSAFILDTQEGHMWLWGACKETGITLMYLGKLRVGEKPLDMLFSAGGKDES